jgi:hypothetical protein
MRIELTEQQARSVAEAARQGMKVVQAGIAAGSMNPGDQAAAFRGIEILDNAWQVATGKKGR